MYTTNINPRFAETDAMGHISNTVLPIWFEEGRLAIFKAVHPSQTLYDWPMIVARIAVDFVAQIHVGKEVIIHTGVSKLGNTSITILQEAWQDEHIVARGEAIMVYFDYQTNKAMPLTDAVKERLAPLLITS